MINLRLAALCGAFLLIAANSFAAGRTADDGSFRILHYEPVLSEGLREPARLAGRSIRFHRLCRRSRRAQSSLLHIHHIKRNEAKDFCKRFTNFRA